MSTGVAGLLRLVAENRADSPQHPENLRAPRLADDQDACPRLRVTFLPVTSIDESGVTVFTRII